MAQKPTIPPEDDPIVFGTRYAEATMGPFSHREKVRMRGWKNDVPYWVPSP